MGFQVLHLSSALMGKVFSLIGLVVAILLLVVFAVDMATGDPATGSGVFFMGFSKAMDIGFIIAATILGYLSFATYRELP